MYQEEEYDYQEFMDRLHLKFMGIYPELRPYSPTRYPDIKKEYDQLDQDMKTLFTHLFKEPTKPKYPKPLQELMKEPDYDYDYYSKLQGNQEFDPIKFEDIMPFQFTKTDMPSCNAIFQKGEHVYRCYDCQLHSACVWCVSCFEESQHKGHRYTSFVTQAGTCDCGNQQVMNPLGFCKKHKGKLIEPIVDQELGAKFIKYVGQVWKWILKMYKVERRNSLTMLIHLCIYLEKINDHSLIYNVLTEKILTMGEPMMVDCLMKMGSEHFDTLLSKFASQMLLKLFSLDSVKLLLAEKYILHYNEDDRFETSDFKYLFIQLFLNYEVVQKVIPKINKSLAPRNRDCDTQQYNTALKRMGVLRRQSAKIFFKPIVESGGIHLQMLRYIDKNIEDSTYNMDYIYKEHKYRKFENSYYEAINVFAKVCQDQPKLLEQQMLNQYQMSSKNKYKKNKVIIPHHRFFAMLVFAYYKCDLEAINAEKVAQIIGLKKNQFLEFIVKFLQFYLKALREFSLTMANRDDSKYEFDDYVEFYAVEPKLAQVYIYDMLALKVFAVILHKLGQPKLFAHALEKVYQEEKENVEKDQKWIRRDLQSVRRQINEQRQMLRRHNKGRGIPPGMMEEMQFQRHYRGYGSFGRGGDRHLPAGQFMRESQQKLQKSAKIHFLEWIHFLHFLIETAYVQRAEVIIANRCGIKNAKTEQTSLRQMVSLFKNAKELTVQQLQTLYPMWFGEEIDKDLLLKVATFDKTKKKYIVRENIEGTPIFKDLLHSFLGNDTYIKYTSKPIEVSSKNQILKGTILQEKVINVFTTRLFQHYNNRPFRKNVMQIRYFAGLIKLIGYVLGTQNSQSKELKANVLKMANNFGVAEQISLIFEQQAQIVPKEKTQAEKRRLEELKRRQKEKFKNLKKNANENIKKILDNQIEKMDVQGQSTDECIICRGGGQLFYLGLYGESSFMFNTLKLNGTYPYFHCCFHAIHYGCFLQLCKDQDKIVCPLCKAVTNILLPSQTLLQKSPAALAFLNQRLQIISTLQAKNKEVENLNLHLSKCFIHLFFLNLLKKGQVHQKKLRLYKIVLQLLKKRYEQLNQNDKFNFENHINGLSLIYNSEIQASYPLNQFIQLIVHLTLRVIKGQKIHQGQLAKTVKKLTHLPSIDIKRSLSFASQIFGQANYSAIEVPNQNSTSLSDQINLYKPPENVKQLLKTRALEEGKCKFGHNAVVCIICNWKGCGDCQQSIDHATNFHCKRSIFFNFITGGVIYIANAKRFKIDCLYISQMSGRPWLAKEKEDDYILDVQLYEQLRQSLVDENLMQFMTSQLKDVEVADLF